MANPNVNWSLPNDPIDVNGTVIDLSKVSDKQKYADGVPLDPNSKDEYIKITLLIIDPTTRRIKYKLGNAIYESIQDIANRNPPGYDKYTTENYKLATARVLSEATNQAAPNGPAYIPPIPESNPIDQIKDVLGIVNDPLGYLDKIAKEYQDPSYGDKLLQGWPVLKYPDNILDTGQDMLKIEQFRYQPPRKSIFDTDNTIKNGIQRGSPLDLKIKSLLKILLPIPNNLQDSNNVSWGPDNMNNLTAAAAGFGLKNTADLAKYVGGGAALGGVTGTGAANVGALAAKGYILSNILKNAGDEAKSLGGISIASQFLNMAGFSVSPESVLANTVGIVPNSNLELLFNAPTLREFRFDYRFSPRSSEEATTVKRIIRSFKQGMAPRKKSSGAAGASSYFLATPNVFKLSYITENKDGISGLNKFKVCALTGFSVNYTPDGQWSSYEGGQPVSYMVSMSFSELEPVYESDYQDNIYGYGTDNERTDLDRVKENDIGY